MANGIDEKNYPKSYTEVLELLKYFDEESLAKIPKEMIEVFENNCDRDYDFHLDLNKPLDEQNLLQETRALIAVIYIDYLASPEERDEIRRRDELELRQNRLKKYNQMLQAEERRNLYD
ncbi:MAG: hypothetical protein NC489_10730 [Ruminococcus flavefaciens]|nr:hypothetical protein [Ruminococcus flavefaciens]